MPEQNKLTKKRTIWTVVLLGLAILGQLYLVFDIEDWSHHRFEVAGYFLVILVLLYGIYLIIKMYRSSHDKA